MGKVDKEDILRAILIDDDFNGTFTPFMRSGCSAFLPLASRKVLDYALEFLSQSGINETVLFCTSKADLIKDYIRNSRWSLEGSSMKIIVMVSEMCNSIGDALRDIDNKAVIKSDFILLSTSTITNINLKDALQFHKSQTKKDRGAAMTLVLQDLGFTRKLEETTVAVNAETERLLVYQKNPVGTKMQLSMEFIADHPCIRLSSTLKDTGIAICSPSVPPLFSDNFDYQTKEDFIRGLLLNEEILDSRIYCYVTKKYGATASDWPSYQRISSDVIHRWTYPLVPDGLVGSSDSLAHYRGCVYKHPDVNFSRGTKLEMDIVIAKGCKLGSNVRLLRCALGKQCLIGDDVSLEDSYILENVQIHDGAKIKLSVLGDGVVVGSKTTLINCQVHAGVVLEPLLNLADKCVASEPNGSNCEKLGEKAFILLLEESDCESEGGFVQEKAKGLLDPDAESDHETVLSSESESEDSRSASPEADDCTLFYYEVIDSLQRGFEEKLPCGNLILEVNASRYAYNVTLSEVTELTSKAVFSLPLRLQSPAKPILQYFKPLFENYVKTDTAQMECLSAFKECFEGLGAEMNACIHYLYDSDVLTEEVIQEWYGQLKKDEPIKLKLEKFITWLNEAAEESDD